VSLKVLIVCHASASLGMGHLSRMLALADAWKLRPNVQLKFLIQGDSVTKKGLSDIPYQFFSQDLCLEKTVTGFIQNDKPDAIVFDLHPNWVNEQLMHWIRQLKRTSIKVIGVDNLKYADACDSVHIPAFWIEPCKLQQCSSSVDYGWNSFLLPAVKDKKKWRPGNKVLVLTGSSDVSKLSETWPEEIDACLPAHMEIHWVQGPFAHSPHVPEKARLNWVVHRSLESLEHLYQTTTYAVTLFGVSFFELLQYGIPTLVFSIFEKDKPMLERLVDDDVCIVADDRVDAVKKLQALIKHDEQALSLSEHAQAKMCVSGAERLVFTIEQLTLQTCVA
jgi:spore coat polysaccharide biosynthesis predicted glycosyltransferase SpsG